MVEVNTRLIYAENEVDDVLLKTLLESMPEFLKFVVVLLLGSVLICDFCRFRGAKTPSNKNCIKWHTAVFISIGSSQLYEPICFAKCYTTHNKNARKYCVLLCAIERSQLAMVDLIC